MIKIFFGGLSFLFAAIMALAASHLLFSCILPWRRAPTTTHMTVIFGGMQFTGWQLLVPFGVSVFAVVLLIFVGVKILRRRH